MGVFGENLNSDLNLAATCHTNAGNYLSDLWQFTDPAGNYKFSSNRVGALIKKATPTVIVTPLRVVYDGQPHHAEVTVTGVGIDGDLNPGDANVTYTAHTDAGNYQGDVWTFTSPNPNYVNSTGKIYDVIGRAAPTIVSVSPLNSVYNGQAQHATVVIHGVGGFDLSPEVTYTTQTSAGSYSGDVWSLSDPNYETVSGKTGDVIAKAALTVVSVTPLKATYDGNPRNVTVVIQGVGGVDLSGEVTYTQHTNAGVYAGDTWSVSDPNYKNINGKTYDVIFRAYATLNIVSYATPFDGSVHCATGTATGVKGEPLSSGLNFRNNDPASLSGTCHQAKGSYLGDTWTFTAPDPINYFNMTGKIHDVID